MTSTTDTSYFFFTPSHPHFSDFCLHDQTMDVFHSSMLFPNPSSSESDKLYRTSSRVSRVSFQVEFLTNTSQSMTRSYRSTVIWQYESVTDSTGSFRTGVKRTRRQIFRDINLRQSIEVRSVVEKNPQLDSSCIGSD